jgi:manganese transport protein
MLRKHFRIPREFLRYLGPGFLVTLGFIDPGNWATNIAGGSNYAYELLWVITLSTIMLILLQHLAAKLGIITGRSLAANIRSHFHPWLSWFFGITIILACIATDLAEYLGAALGFQILLGIPLAIGAPLTVVFVITLVLGQRYHSLERMLVVFLAVIAACYLVELVIVKPDWGLAAVSAFRPKVSSDSILIAMGMLGAVVMPHNIYLHSNTIQSRDWEVNGDPRQYKRLMRYEMADTVLSMTMGWLVNSSMIIVAAAVFFRNNVSVTSIEEASRTLEPLVGPLAGLLFAVALLFAGIGSSITSSVSEANVVTGFLGRPEDIHSRFYRIGLIVTSIPAMVIIAAGVDSFKALIWSQVALSIQLPMTVIPLLLLTSSKKVMGEHASSLHVKVMGWIIAIIVIGLNILLLYQTLGGKF